MSKLNFYWLIDNETAGHSEPQSESDLSWLWNQGIRALIRMSEHPMVNKSQIDKLGFEDLYIPVPDYTAPSQGQLHTMVKFIMNSAHIKKPVAVSCGMGIGRTGTVLACYLAHKHGFSEKFTAEKLLALVREKRPGAVETAQQLDAIKKYIKIEFS